MKAFDHAYCVSHSEKHQQKGEIPPNVLHIPISEYDEATIGVQL